MIKCQNLTVSYNRHPVIHHIYCQLETGSLTAVIGPNGAGKSSFLKVIAGLISHYQGRISFDPKPARVAYLAQQSALDKQVPMTVYGLVAAGAWHRMGAFKRINQSLKADIKATIDAVGLGGFESRSVHNLSGGQLQRALFARLIMQDADLILLDEPFSAVDEHTQQHLLTMIKQWHQHGKTVLVVLHDYALVKAHFSDALLLARELIAYGQVNNVLTAENIATATGLREAFDEQAELCQQDELHGI